MTDEQWPPPPDEASRWYVEPARDARGLPEERQVLRAVRLWGREVLVDGRGRVFCDGCRVLVAVEQLSPWRGPHRLSAPHGVPASMGARPAPVVPLPAALVDQALVDQHPFVGREGPSRPRGFQR